jgi:uncharacterized membrane protein
MSSSSPSSSSASFFEAFLVLLEPTLGIDSALFLDRTGWVAGILPLD